MNKKMFLLMIGVMAISACSSKEAHVKAEETVATQDVVIEEPAIKTIKKTEMAQEKPVMDSVEDKPSKMDAPSNNSAATNNTKISICKNGKHIRIISIIYKHNASSTSCDVTYEKSSGVKTLWNAKSDLSYCENKAANFVKKQEGWGWKCSNFE